MLKKLSVDKELNAVNTRESLQNNKKLYLIRSRSKFILKYFQQKIKNNQSLPPMKLKRNNIRRANRFTNAFRFIHDLTVSNNGAETGKSFRENLSLEFTLKRQN